MFRHGGIVGAAGPVALTGHTHRQESELSITFHHAPTKRCVIKARHLIAAHFNTGMGSRMAHPDLAKSQSSEHRFRRLDLRQLLFRHLQPMRDARGETRVLRPVPVRHAQPPCQLTDLSLLQSGFLQGRAHAARLGRLLARTIRARIIADGAVEHDGDLPRRGLAPKRLKQRVLAQSAAPRRIQPIRGLAHLIGLNHQMLQIQLLRHAARLIQVGAGERGGIRRHGNHPGLSQHRAREGGEQRGIHPSRERHHHPPASAQDALHPLAFLFELRLIADC